MQEIFLEAKNLILNAENILVLLHRFPDGDTISSSLALATYLKRIGKNVDCAVKEGIPDAFAFLVGANEIKMDFLLGDYDLIIAVDCGDTNRTGFPSRLESICKTKPFINIDHHLKNNLIKVARVNMVDESAAAAAEVVWEFLIFMQAKIDVKIATYILAGIYYDTGGFFHSNVTDKTLKIAAECLRAGARIGFISQHINSSKTPSALKLWGLALRRMEINKIGVASTYLTFEDLARCGGKIEDTSGIVNLINTVPSAKVAILFIGLPDGKIKASLRTEESIDVAKLARVFCGGGHKKAAGFMIDGSIIKSKLGWKIEFIN